MKQNIFRRSLFLIFILLTPIMILYSYSHQVSLDVVQDEIKFRNLDRISISSNQIDRQMNELSYFLYSLSVDSDVTKFKARDLFGNYGSIELNQRILEKIKLQSALNNWSNQITVYFPEYGDMIALDYRKYDKEYVNSQLSSVWKIKMENKQNQYFIKHIMLPYNNQYDPQFAEVIIEAKYSLSNVEGLFDQMKVKETEGVFLFHDEEPPFIGQKANMEIVGKVANALRNLNLNDKGNEIVKINKEDYLVSYIKSEVTGWTLVDYVQLKEILRPIYVSKNLFYVSLFLLLVLSVIVAFLLYRYVHVPIRKLIASMMQIEMGNYESRLKVVKNNEFSYVFNKFNLMAEKIQNLIEEVYEEKIRANQAMMKQLQAQINPHFLYNCLSFIKSMTKLKMRDAVLSMVSHLGEFYRYTTYVEKQNVTIRDEIRFTTNYLEIHVLRMKRITYSIEIPEHMLVATIPRLLIQPIVENAIIHGIEPKEGRGYVRISAVQTSSKNRIVIEDNGVGMTDEEIFKLNLKIKQTMDGNEKCGLWNVNQRLVYFFGKEAGINLKQGTLGGLCVQFEWPITEVE